MKVTAITPGYLRPFLPRRAKSGHKGDYGKVLVVAGSKGMAGAAVLAARAALKAGAGLVTVACPDAAQPVIACALPEAMTLPLPSKDGAAALKSAGKVLAFLEEKKYDVCLVGPGLSLKGEAPEFVRALLKKLLIPAVVDADALNALSSGRSFIRLTSGPVRIFTPHEGEALRFCDGALPGIGRFGPAAGPATSRRFLLGPNRPMPGSTPARLDILTALHALLGGVCILKGDATLVTDGRRLLRNTSGGPVLAKGGSGDVLAGLIAGLWAQAGRRSGFTAETALESAALGVYLHGVCGDLAAKKLTERGVLAGELLEFLPRAFRTIKEI